MMSNMSWIWYYALSFIDPHDNNDIPEIGRDVCDLTDGLTDEYNGLSDIVACVSDRRVRGVCVARYITSVVRNCWVRHNTAEYLASMFDRHNVSTYDKYRHILAEFDMKYDRTLYEPNTCIGILASTSVSESSTQSVLNAFHYSGTTSGGQSSMSAGLPRILQLLSVSKDCKMKCLTFKLLGDKYDKYDKYEKSSSYKEALKLEHRIMRDFVRSYSIYDGLNPKNAGWAARFRATMSQCESDFIPYTIEMTLDGYDLYKHGINMIDVCNAIQSKYLDVYCMFSPDPERPVMVIYVRNTVDDIQDLLGYINHVLLKILSITVCGIEGVSKVYVADGGGGVVSTDGGDLAAVIRHPKINGKSVLSSDVYETFCVLGIEACRALMFYELKKTFAQSGISVNETHLEVLIDVMTNSGQPMPVSRYGVETDSFIAQACFEESLNMLLRAAVLNKTDNMRSSSSSVLMGTPIVTGTGRNIELYLRGAVGDRPAPL